MGRLASLAMVMVLWAAFPASAVPLPGHGARSRPAAFVENRGQWAPLARYLLIGAREVARIEDGAFSVALRRGGEGVVVRFAFEDASPGAIVEGEGLTGAAYSFFLGRDRSRWRGGIPGEERVLLRGLYPGIDVRFRAAEGRGNDRGSLEYDLLAGPGADLSRVVLRVEGGDDLELAVDGSLRVKTCLGDLRQPPPAAWQELRAGERRPVQVRFKLLGKDRYGLEAEDVLPDLFTVVDPVLEWIVMEGGGGDDYPWGLKVDSSGDIILAGGTWSSDFPATVGAYQETQTGLFDAFLLRLDPQGTLRQATYLGGAFDDEAVAVDLAPDGAVLVSGYTTSSDFPATNGSSYAGTEGDESTSDAFVAKLSPHLDDLLYATFLGGPARDVSFGVGPYPGGGIAVGGFTFSGDFPTTPEAFQHDRPGGRDDNFIARLSPDAGPALEDQLVYSSYLSGSDQEVPDSGGGFSLRVALRHRAFAVTPAGEVIIACSTSSSDYPVTPGAFPLTLAQGGDGQAAVTKLAPDPELSPNEQLRYSTVFGGPDNADGASNLTLAPDGSLWISGWTWSSAFPTTPGAYKRTVGVTDPFLLHLVPDATLPAAEQLLYSTYFGGSDADQGTCAPVLVGDLVALLFFTRSSDLPLSAFLLKTAEGVGTIDGFLAMFDPRKTGLDQLVYSTYFGGLGFDLPTVAALAADSRLIVAGQTNSPDFGSDGSWHGAMDAFVLALDVLPPDAAFTIAGPDALGRVSVDASASKPIPGTAILGYAWDFEDGSTAAGVRADHVYATPGRFAVRLAVTSDRGPVGTMVSAPFVIPPPPCGAAPWNCADVGVGSLRGSARGDGPDCLEAFASGAGIKGTADGFHFVYRSLEGDGTLTARIPADGTDPRAPRAGVMLREGLEPGARHATMLLAQSDQGSRPFFLHRARAGEGTSSKPNPRALSQAEAWIRIERQGDDFTGSYSTDGKAFTELGRVTLPGLSARLLAGLAAPASDVGEVPFPLPRTTFCDIEISGNLGGPAFLRGDADASGERDITDAITTLNHLFAGGTAPPCLDAVDTNDDGGLDLTDAVNLLGYLFLAGEKPPPPFESCGPDPTPDDLGCVEFTPCG